MIILKARRTWKHAGAMPLLRTLVLDGAIYYCVFIFAFSLDILAKSSREVGVLHLYHVYQALTRRV